MGYSHSWVRPRELDREAFAAASRDCQRVCEASGVKLKGVEGAPLPIFAEFIVAFDGGCEWFVTQCICDERSPERPCRDRLGLHYGFTKTEHLPYDICVQASLIAFRHHIGDEFEIRSDGDSAAWDAARDLCQRTVGYGSDFTLSDPE